MTFLGEIEILGKARLESRDESNRAAVSGSRSVTDLRPDASTGKVSAAMRLA